VRGKPPFRPTLDHLDRARSDPLEPPWPELIITIGRRPSMAALWARERSGGRTRIVLLGKPSGLLHCFDLVIASSEIQMPPLPNVLRTALPFMRVDPEAAAAAAAHWHAQLAPLPRPLVAFLVGGQTHPFVMDERVAHGLQAQAQQVVARGGTPYFTTSLRTAAPVVEALRQGLPGQARLHAWSASGAPEDNPYLALLGSADAFVVTGDSISMQVEVVRLGRPLAIYPLPTRPFSAPDLWRRRIATWLNRPRCEGGGDRLRHTLARAVYRVDRPRVFSMTRDFEAFHRLLVGQGLAVWAGDTPQPPRAAPPDDLELATRRIRELFPAAFGYHGRAAVRESA
jgi:mitochondrial fission protein ELM1